MPNRFRFIQVAEALSRVVPDSNRRVILSIRHGQALFNADHDLKPQEAYANATREYAARRDIYGADAVAWTALKAGKLAAAQKAMGEALRLGTQDAKLFYHAGMIARAAGDRVAAIDYLKRALALSPQFDPLQARNARSSFYR